MDAAKHHSEFARKAGNYLDEQFILIDLQVRRDKWRAVRRGLSLAVVHYRSLLRTTSQTALGHPNQ